MANLSKSPVEPVYFLLNSNKALIPRKLIGASHHYSKLSRLYSIAIDVLMFLNNYCYVLLKSTLALVYSVFSIIYLCIVFLAYAISNGAQ